MQLQAEAVSLSPSPTLYRNQLKLSGCLLSQHSKHSGVTAAWRPPGTVSEWWMSTALSRNLQRESLTVFHQPWDVGAEGVTAETWTLHLCRRDLGVPPAPHLPSSPAAGRRMLHPPRPFCVSWGWLQGLQNLELCHV